MLLFTIRRLLITIPVLLATSILVFLLVSTAGDPLSDLKMNPHTPKNTIRLKEAQLHDSDPLWYHYYRWLKGFVQGNFGHSDNYPHLGTELFHRMEVTLRLVVLSILFAAILALAVGIYTAVKQYSPGDYVATIVSFVFLSMPTFWLAVLLKDRSIDINKFVGGHPISTIGDKSIDPPAGFFGQLGDYSGHLILPTITLALISYASWSQFQRASMLEVLGSDYIRLARAKGLTRGRVLIKHAVRTALIPFTTVVALDTAGILSGTVITETIYQWHGMGEFGLLSITHKDLNATLAWLMLTSVIVIAFNLIADLLYAVLDPRIRYA